MTMLDEANIRELKKYIEEHASKVKSIEELNSKISEEIQEKCEEIPSWKDIHKKETLYVKMSNVSFYINKLSQIIGDIEKEKQELKQFIALLSEIKVSKISDVLKTKTNSLKDKVVAMQEESRERRNGLQTLFKLYTNFQFIATSNELE